MRPTVVEEDVRSIVERLGAALEPLAGKSLLITGGTGFVGSYLLETIAYVNDRVLPSPCHVYATTRDPERVARRLPHLQGRPDLTFIRADVRTFRPGLVSWDFVIHGAATSDVQTFMREPLAGMDTIVEGTRAVLEAAVRARPQRVLFLSTGAVYGHQPAEIPRLSEDCTWGPDVRNPRSGYAEAKRYAEMLCRLFQTTHGLPVTIGRLFALLGPYQDLNATSAVIDFIRQVLRGPTITIRDDGQTTRSYCYIADAVVALWKLLVDGRPGDVVNIGSDLDAVSFVELAQRIGRCAGRAVTVHVEGAPASGVLGRRYIPDITKMRLELGVHPATVLDQALGRTITWMKAQPSEGG